MPHGAAPFLVTKLPAIQSRILGAERGGGAGVRRGSSGWIREGRQLPPQPAPLPEPPALRVLRSAAVPAAAAGGRPRTAPAGRLLPRGEPLGAPEIDLLVHTRMVDRGWERAGCDFPPRGCTTAGEVGA